MTKAELIEALKNCPDDALVILSDGSGYTELEKSSIEYRSAEQNKQQFNLETGGNSIVKHNGYFHYGFQKRLFQGKTPEFHSVIVFGG